MRLIVVCLILFFSLAIFSPQSLSQDTSFPVKITSQTANVRSDSTVNSEIITEVPKGKILTVVKSFYEWYRVELPDDAPCYISSQYVSVIGDNVAAVKNDNVNLRLKPDTKSVILGKVSRDKIVNISGTQGNWYRIVPPEEARGWIHKSTALSLPAAELKPQTPPTVAKPKEQASDIITLEGKVSDRGKTLGLFNKQLSHKLVTTDNKEYFLKGNKYKLNMFVNSIVRIKGKILTDIPKQKYPVIEVDSAQRLN